ncbi:Uncharacterized protein OBRU01_23182 [Operophtera brumata]|uniref:Uncharacterized protein n=1 Tax=Operophtera brumata TaxID=104452 RepID=A0A0L7KQ86_OPEBR|nr:Uncharacterized protein OBRU01_23182 [Operophtera brumata]
MVLLAARRRFAIGPAGHRLQNKRGGRYILRSLWFNVPIRDRASYSPSGESEGKGLGYQEDYQVDRSAQEFAVSP